MSKEQRKEYNHSFMQGYIRKERKVLTEERLRTIIGRVCAVNDFELTDNAEKIIAAKLRMCKEDLKLCVCDRAPDSKRYCGSAACRRECRENGYCHCHLFKLKDGIPLRKKRRQRNMKR